MNADINCPAECYGQGCGFCFTGFVIVQPKNKGENE